MEKAILAGYTDDIVTEHQRFREAWQRAGCPSFFRWDGSGPGRVYSREEFQRLKSQEEKKACRMRREYEEKEEIHHLRQQFDLKVARRRLRQRFEKMCARKKRGVSPKSRPALK